MTFLIRSFKSNEEFQPKVVKRYEPIVEENEEASSPRDSKTMRNIKIVIQLEFVYEFIETYFQLISKQKKLKELAKDQIKNHYKDVEKAWSEVDVLNSNEMSKDMMWNLFRKWIILIQKLLYLFHQLK